MAYSKSAYAKQLGISNSELERKAKQGGFKNTEEYYNSKQGGGSSGGYQDVMNNQVKQENEFLGRYNKAISAQPTVSDIFSRLSTERGLPQLQNTSRNLQANLEAVPENVMTNAKQFGMSSSRIGQRVAAEQSRLAPIAQKALTQEQNVTGDISTQLQLESASQDKALLPYQTEASMISSRLASAMTGWTTQKNNDLSVLLQKMQTQAGLQSAEMTRLAELAKAEDDFEKQKALIVFNKNLSGGGGGNRPALPRA